jgi:hypothetical protein
VSRRPGLMPVFECAAIGVLWGLLAGYGFGLLWAWLDPTLCGGCCGTDGGARVRLWDYVVRPVVTVVALGPLAMSVGGLAALWFRSPYCGAPVAWITRALVAAFGASLLAGAATMAIDHALPSLILGKWPPASKVLSEGISFGIAVGGYSLPWLAVASWRHGRAAQQ